MDDRKITISDIANDLNLSRSTVSRAISGKGRISKETVQRVMDYVEKCNYSPNIIAKSLANSKTYNILFLLPMAQSTIDMPFFHNCLFGVTTVAEENFYDVIILDQCQDDISNVKRVVRNNKIDGVILSRAFENDKAIEYLKQVKMPFVLIGNYNDDSITNVDSKHEIACYEITSQLLKRKDCKIGLIGGDTKNIVNTKRLKGFEKAVREQKIDRNSVSTYLNIETNEYIDIIVEEFLSKNVKYIFCLDDAICLKVINRLNTMESYLYDQVELVSFYSNEYIDYNYPNIHRLRFDVKGLGVTACLDLIEKIECKTVVTHKLLDYEILIQ